VTALHSARNAAAFAGERSQDDQFSIHAVSDHAATGVGYDYQVAFNPGARYFLSRERPKNDMAALIRGGLF
jgi:hypothetical protein